MLTQYVHPRLGLPKFRFFEPFFLQALQAFDRGEDTKFTLDGGLSPTTVAARMRDSLQGLRLNNTNWESQIDPEVYRLYFKHEGKFVIAGPDSDGNVWMRKRLQTGKKGGTQFTQVEGELGKHVRVSTVQQVATHSAPQPIRAGDCAPDTVKQFAHLKAGGHIAAAVIFPGPLDPTDTAGLSHDNDIHFHYDPSRNETILL